MNADEQLEFKRLKDRVAALESRDITRVFRDDHDQPNPAPQPQYREPTLEDALELIRANAERAPIEQLGTVRNSVLQALKQLGFVRKVQP